MKVNQKKAMTNLIVSPLADGLDIACSYKPVSCHTQGVEFNVGAIQVSGTYPNGSKGSLTAQYLSSIGIFARNYYGLDALIWDFSNLQYEWGDGLRRIYDPTCLEYRPIPGGDNRDWYGYAIITSPQNKRAISSLVEAFSGKEGVSLHADLSSAVTAIKEEINTVDWSS